jgi:hypothetical protein
MSGQCKIQNLITIPISHQNTILLSVHTLPSITSFTGISRLAICTKRELKKYKKEDFLCAGRVCVCVCGYSHEKGVHWVFR